MPQQPNQFDVVACLIKAEIILKMGDTKTRLSLYDTVEIGKNMDRGFENYGTEEARLIIMKKL